VDYFQNSSPIRTGVNELVDWYHLRSYHQDAASSQSGGIELAHLRSFAVVCSEPEPVIQLDDLFRASLCLLSVQHWALCCLTFLCK